MGSAYRCWLSLICLVLVGCCWGSPALAAHSLPSTVAEAAQVSPQLARDGGIEHLSLTVARQRLEAIAEAMRSIRLCNRPNCRYRDIAVDVWPVDISIPNGGAEPFYEGSIDAMIDRPSGSLDRAHYRLQFRQGRWQLLGGEEVSDVSSFFFEGDTYEVFSAYGTRSHKAKLADAGSNLRVGYRELYYRVFDRGQERLH
ncbi:hypothetical protein [Thermostichus sp. MS-CIW-37]|jgi:hypothetical protein